MMMGPTRRWWWARTPTSLCPFFPCPAATGMQVKVLVQVFCLGPPRSMVLTFGPVQPTNRRWARSLPPSFNDAMPCLHDGNKCRLIPVQILMKKKKNQFHHNKIVYMLQYIQAMQLIQISVDGYRVLFHTTGLRSITCLTIKCYE